MASEQHEDKKPVKLSLRRNTIDVEVEGENGQTIKLQLREMSGLERDQYLDTLRKRATLDKTGKPTGISTAVNLQADLICRCLVDVEGSLGEPGKLVSLDKIKDFPASLQKYLADECTKLNRMDQDSKDEAKKG